MKALQNVATRSIVAWEVKEACTFGTRLVGWMGHSPSVGSALWLRPCRSIHTFFMKTRIDVLFLDKENQVVGALKSVAPYRIPKAYVRADSVIELPVGTIERTGTQVGHMICWVPLFEQ